MSALAARFSRGTPVTHGKRGRDDDRAQGAEHGELSGTEHRPGARRGVPASFQARHALEGVAGAGEEEVRDAVGDRECQGTPDGGPDRPLLPVPRLVLDQRLKGFPGVEEVEPRLEDDVAYDRSGW